MARQDTVKGDFSKTGNDRGKVTRILHVEDPEKLLAELRRVAHLAAPDFDWPAFHKVYKDVMALFSGDFPGFRSCNTPYHDLAHTLDVVLATARLLHGVSIEHHLIPLDSRYVLLCLIAALMHDTGYIQETHDTEGTGAKHTRIHVERSADFARTYLLNAGFSEADAEKCAAMILCTELSSCPSSIAFQDAETRVAGKILGTADLLGQMASRNYLEKLVLLYRELVEGEVDEFSSELDLLEKTKGFYEFIRNRMECHLDGLCTAMRSHFRERFALDRDLYAEYAEKNVRYLSDLLSKNGDAYRSELRRAGSVIGTKFTE